MLNEDENNIYDMQGEIMIRKPVYKNLIIYRIFPDDNNVDLAIYIFEHLLAEKEILFMLSSKKKIADANMISKNFALKDNCVVLDELELCIDFENIELCYENIWKLEEKIRAKIKHLEEVEKVSGERNRIKMQIYKKELSDLPIYTLCIKEMIDNFSKR